MAAEQRKLLEQLMGAEALMGAGASQQEKLSITDPKVCRSYLVGQCPHGESSRSLQNVKLI